MGSIAENTTLIAGLQQPENCKSIPFHLLYDDRGSELYKRITELQSYYLFQAEKSLLQANAVHIAQQIAPDSIIVELGCGVAEKTSILLHAVQKTHQRCHYVGIDVSQSALDEAKHAVDFSSPGFELELVRADFLEGLALVRSKYPERALCLLWLGSGMGNLSRSESVDFNSELLRLAGPRCQFFLCVDMWKDEQVLRAAYDDPQGVTASFIKNGMRHGLELLGHEVSEEDLQTWRYEVDINSKLHQVEMFIRFPDGLSLPEHGIHVRKNERVLVEISCKFTDDDILQLSSQLGLVRHAKWSSREYSCYMLLSCEAALMRCWNDTDALFGEVKDWYSKPIPFRHPFCFYYGHVVAFARLKLLESSSFSGLTTMFSRGIDPLMLDPSKCHKHPASPAQWPDKQSLIDYTNKTRAELLQHLAGSHRLNMRRFNLILEHERMHQETLAYMLAQERKLSFGCADANLKECILRSCLRKPMVVSKPDVLITAGSVVLGCEPHPEVFRIDNEQPAVTREVESDFWVSSSPVSVSEFMLFVTEGGYTREEFWQPDDFKFLQQHNHQLPATWSCSSQGSILVHSHDSTSDWSEVAHQPVFVSLMEAEAFCRWMGWRVMSEAEYQRVLDEQERLGDKFKVRELRNGGWEWTSSAFMGFEGFEAMEEYPEYSVDFFDGLHFVLKGSSAVTHTSLLRDSFRNFYQRQYPYVFAKFRGCK